MIRLSTSAKRFIYQTLFTFFIFILGLHGQLIFVSVHTKIAAIDPEFFANGCTYLLALVFIALQYVKTEKL